MGMLGEEVRQNVGLWDSVVTGPEEKCWGCGDTVRTLPGRK